MEINHALIAVAFGQEDLDVFHFCGFKNKPTFDETVALQERLRNDPKYNLVGNDSFHVTDASPAMVEYYKRLNPADEDAYYVDETGAIVKM